MPSPLVEVKDGAGAYASAVGGVDVTPGNTITIHLIDSSARSWSLQCLTTDDLSDRAAVNTAIAATIDPIARTATFTAPVAGRAYRFQSQVNGGVNASGRADGSYTTTFCIYTVVTASGRRVHAVDETYESDPTFGWVADLNNLIREPLASPVITGTPTYAAARGTIHTVVGEVQTSSTSPATVASFAMSDETLCAFDVIVTCAKRTAVTKGGRYKRSVVYRRTSAGAPTIVGSLESGTDSETTSGDDVTIDVSSNTVRVRVTAADSDGRNWFAELRVQETLST